jgi:drug/metabolite transporter (DMT)-like permease
MGNSLRRDAETTPSERLTSGDYYFLFMSGLIGNGIPAFLFSYAGTLIPSGLSGIMNAFTPMFTLLLGVIFFKDRFTGSGLIGVVLGILGAVILLAPGFIFHSGAQISGLGVIMVTCAAMMYGYNINLYGQPVFAFADDDRHH